MENGNWSIISHQDFPMLLCGADDNTSYLCLTKNGVNVPICALVEFAVLEYQELAQMIADSLNKTNPLGEGIPNDLFQ
jgi:hypothetical protein